MAVLRKLLCVAAPLCAGGRAGITNPLLSSTIKSIYLPQARSALFPVPRRSCSSVPQAPQIQIHRLQGASSGIAAILLRRPHARNSLGNTLVKQLREAVEDLRHDKSVRVVLFKSEVKGVFCAGADLKERAKMSNPEAAHFVHKLRSLMNDIASLPMPTIAAVDGFALGGGLELAMACDLRIAASSAMMGLIEVTRGLLPGAGGSQRLPRIVGIGLAKELIFTGRRINGEQALTIGLVNDAVTQNDSGDAAYQRAMDLSKEILSQGPVALRMAKLAINRGIEVDILSGMAIEEMCYAQVIPTKDRQEGMTAFIEKRAPHFTGE
ncbi:enoyl-CoA hydratase domain-containing protein 2, mitochondrial [Callorhinchus milii]|uniref:Enoyl CoA hydratase domain containing 2 n=1 Tax=Callorhinchus milii TaxID=7868 RepID=A0A4W3HVW0_CALMI|nr:enoyl-CoA hydratase domain-containing protein 2, mitochondrial [Callorhinchus milii]|eukprot:gi/632963722/ref/XP_007898044.1/ PREDICTED: enoyl-CoA hydratase domain-containing protein 2, mitochondrial [Callorhinchus milii]